MLPLSARGTSAYATNNQSVEKKSACFQNIIRLVGEIAHWTLKCLCFSFLRSFNPDRLHWFDIPYVDSSNLNQLKENHVKYLSPDQIIHLTNENLIKALSPDQIIHLTNENFIKALSPDQITNLQGDHVKKIQSIFSREILNKFPCFLIEKLTTSQILILTDPMRIDLITREQLSSFTSPEISCIQQPTLLKKLSADQIPHVSLSFINWLTEEQIPHLTFRQFLCLSEVSLQNAVTDTQIRRLTKEEIQELKSPTLLKKLSADQIPHVSLSFINWLTKEQIPHLTSGQFLRLSKLSLQEAVTDDQIHRLTESEIKVLRNPIFLKKLSAEQIPHVSRDFINFLTEEQIPYLTSQQLPFLHFAPLVNAVTDIQIQRLTPAEIQEIKSSNLLKKLSAEQIPHVPSANFIHLSEIQIGWLSYNQVIELTRIGGAPKTLLSSVTEDQLRLFTSEQVYQINHPALLKKLQPHQIRFIRSNLVKFITENQVQYLDPPQIIYLTNRKFVANLTPEQCTWFNNTMTAEDVSRNENPCIVSFIKDTLVPYIKNEQLIYIQDSQVPFLTDSQIEFLFKTNNAVASGSGSSPPFVMILTSNAETSTNRLEHQTESNAKNRICQKLSDTQIKRITEDFIILNIRNNMALQTAIKMHGTPEQKNILDRIIEYTEKTLSTVMRTRASYHYS